MRPPRLPRVTACLAQIGVRSIRRHTGNRNEGIQRRLLRNIGNADPFAFLVYFQARVDRIVGRRHAVPGDHQQRVAFANISCRRDDAVGLWQIDGFLQRTRANRILVQGMARAVAGKEKEPTFPIVAIWLSVVSFERAELDPAFVPFRPNLEEGHGANAGARLPMLPDEENVAGWIAGRCRRTQLEAAGRERENASNGQYDSNKYQVYAIHDALSPTLPCRPA